MGDYSFLKDRSTKPMRLFLTRTTTSPCGRSVPVMLFDSIEAQSSLRLNGDFTGLQFQERGSSWPAVTAKPQCVCIIAEVEVRSSFAPQQKGDGMLNSVISLNELQTLKKVTLL